MLTAPVAEVTSPAVERPWTYRPALDGVRALAVAVVFAYHANLAWAEGGFLGVDVFFVLSGFLITGLLLADHEHHGRLRLTRFWGRRARRLLPALFLLLVAVSVAVPLLAADQNFRLRGDLLSALGYVTNWQLIFQDLSYFQAIGRPPLLQHLWSLAVEEQFYLVWPLVLIVLLRWFPSRRRLATSVVVLAGVSTVLMALLYVPTEDPSRVYYGTDTRVAALLVGAALACLWPRRGTSDPASKAPRLVLEVAGWAAVGFLAWCVVSVNQYRAQLYRGGFLVVALASLAVVAVGAAHRPTTLSSALAWRPLVWLGQRSYGIYLWFWPVMMLTRPHSDVPLSGYRLVLLQAAITLVLAAASYRFVEMPIRSGVVQRAWRERRDGLTLSSTPRLVAWGAIAVVAFCALGVGIAFRRDTPPTDPLFVSAAAEDVPLSSTAIGSMDSTTTTSMAPAAATAPPAPLLAPNPITAAPAPPSTQAITAKITVIGESVMLGTKHVLQSRIPQLALDAAVARQAATTIATARTLRDQGQLGEEVVLHVGTNGVITAAQFDEFMEVFRGVRRVVVVNVAVPRPWEGPNNEVLAAGVARTPNAVLADWHSLGRAHPEAFRDDGVHLTPLGANLLVELIVSYL